MSTEQELKDRIAEHENAIQGLKHDNVWIDEAKDIEHIAITELPKSRRELRDERKAT